MKQLVKLFYLVILFTNLVYASESAQVEQEVTIDSPPEVIAEDFLRVATVPPSWFYLLYNWVSTFDIDPNNITDADLEKYVTNEHKRESIKKAINIIKKFDSYPGEYRLIKWETMPIDISLTHETEMDEALRQTIKLIEKNTDIRFDVQKERITKNGITVDTFGLEKEHTDFCVHDYACTDLVITGSTTYFKGDGAIKSLEKIKLDYFLRTPDINQRRFDKVYYFTPNTSFTERHGHDYHVNGAILHAKENIQLYSGCDIYNNHNDKEISKSLTSECVLRALGLFQFSFNENSLLSQRSLQLENVVWKTKPNEYDLFLLKILYDKRLKSGMTREEVKPLLVQIINDIKYKGMGD